MCGSSVGATRRYSPILVVGLVAVAGASAGTPAGFYAVGLLERAGYEHIHSDLLYTHNGHDRLWGPEHDQARNNIETLLRGYGLSTTLDPFVYGGQTYYNVVAERIGTTRPDEIYIIGAHYDSYSSSGPAPGADDNASGVAGVLSIAALVSQWESAATIRFIAFDREEQGLRGSTAYAQAHAQDDIRGVVIVDMIAHNATVEPLSRVWGRPTSAPLKAAVIAAVRDYSTLNCVDSGRKDSSDHVPFEGLGFQATLLQEASIPGNVNYHTQWDSVDTPGYIHYDYAVEITRGMLGWLVDAAGVTPDHPLGDLNCDYQVDFGDINPFVLALTHPAAYVLAFPNCNLMNADINGDGFVDFGDINPFVRLLTNP